MYRIPDLNGYRIVTAKYDKHGRLEIELNNGATLFIDDGIGGPVTVEVAINDQRRTLEP